MAKPIVVADDVAPYETWDYKIVQEDENFVPQIEHIGDNRFLIRTNHKDKKIKKDDFGLAICFNSSEEFKPVDKELEAKKLDGDWCKEQGGMGYELLVKDEKTLPYDYVFTVPNDVKNFTIYGGMGSYVVVVDIYLGMVTGYPGIKHRTFYDHINDRWHIVYLDSSQDIHTASSPYNQLENWTDGIDIESVFSYKQGSFACDIDEVEGKSYIGCVGGISTDDDIYYTRCNLTNTTPYIEGCSGLNWIFSGLDAHGINDDIPTLSMTYNASHCIQVYAKWKDSTASYPHYASWYAFKENSSSGCGDHVISRNSNDMIYLHNNDYDSTSSVWNPLMLVQYPNKNDAIIVYINETSTSADLISMYWDGEFGTKQVLYGDIENYNMDMMDVVTYSDNAVVFGADDGQKEIDAYIIEEKDGGLDTKVATGAFSSIGGYWNRGIFGVAVDNESNIGDNIIMFYSNQTDTSMMYYTMSGDGGYTWVNNTKWTDFVEEIMFIDVAFDWEHCMYLINTYTGNDVEVINLSAGDCKVGGEPPAEATPYSCINISDQGIDWNRNYQLNYTCQVNGTVNNLNVGGTGQFKIYTGALTNVTPPFKALGLVHCINTPAGGCIKTY